MMGESGSSVVNHGSEHRHTEERQTAVIRFCGDSGDGMQTAGGYFTTVSAIVGNDVSTFPDYPAEIRAPAGTLAGLAVSKSASQAMTFTRQAMMSIR